MDKFKFKIILIFGILSLGLIGAYLIISGISSSGGAVIANQQDSTDSLNQLQNGGGVFTDNATDTAGSAANAVDNSGNDLSASGNLTEAFSKSLFNQIQAAGISSQNPNSLKNSLPVISSGVLNDLSNISPQFKTISDIADSDLKISSDNSIAAKKNYLNSIIAVVQKDYLDANPDNYVQVMVNVYGKNNDTASAVKSEGIYKNLAGDFINLTVPGDWVAFHKEIIAYYENSEIIYAAMAGYPRDPIKGYAAAGMMNKLLADGVQIRQDLDNMANSVK